MLVASRTSPPGGVPTLPGYFATASLSPRRARPARSVSAALGAEGDTSPIEVVVYDPRWPALYEAERARILWLLGPRLLAIEHIGSTSVRGLGGKPCIDIQIALPDAAAVLSVFEELRWLDYHLTDAVGPNWRMFRKLVPTCYYLHVMTSDSPLWSRNVLQREYLQRHPDVAKAYFRLKRALAAHHTNLPDYSRAKSGFLKELEDKARAEALA